MSEQKDGLAQDASDWNAAVEACAKMAEPKGPRPCDCERCYCHNQGDAEAVASWDAGMATAKAIRLIARPPATVPAAGASAMQRLLAAAGWDAGSVRHKQLEDALDGAHLEIVDRRTPAAVEPAQHENDQRQLFQEAYDLLAELREPLAPLSDLDRRISSLNARIYHNGIHRRTPAGCGSVAWIAFADNGNVRLWTADEQRAKDEKARGLDMRAFTLAELIALVSRLGQAEAQVEDARVGFDAIQKATIEGRVCDDVAWFDTITTLHDFCWQMIDRLSHPSTVEVTDSSGDVFKDLGVSPPPHVRQPGKVCGYHDGCPPDGPVCHLCEHLQP